MNQKQLIKELRRKNRLWNKIANELCNPPYQQFLKYVEKHPKELDTFPISYQTFKATLKYIKSQERYESKLRGLLKDYAGEMQDFMDYSTDISSSIMAYLSDLIHDSKNDSWISYWWYELEEGKLAHRGTVTYKDKNIPIKTARNLYDFLVKLAKEQHEQTS